MPYCYMGGSDQGVAGIFENGNDNMADLLTKNFDKLKDALLSRCIMWY